MSHLSWWLWFVPVCPTLLGKGKEELSEDPELCSLVFLPTKQFDLCCVRSQGGFLLGGLGWGRGAVWVGVSTRWGNRRPFLAH